MIGAAVEDSVSDPALDDLANSLGEGTSALVLWGDVDPFIGEFERFRAKLIRSAIADDVADSIRNRALDAER